MANKLQVKICGQEYTLVSDDSREYMLEMADYVDRKMVAVKNQNNRLSTSMAAILVALNVADDMKHAEAKAKEALTSQAAEIALGTISRFLSQSCVIKKVTMVCFDARTKAAYEEALAKLQTN